jgi:hypothetical protein
MTGVLHCWRCGEGLDKLSLPLSRMDECPECFIHLHVCKMCSCYDPAVPKACREDDAEEVKEKERANFCDYFAPSQHAFDADVAAADRQARSKLDNLFGGDDADKKPDDDTPTNAADDLFK